VRGEKSINICIFWITSQKNRLGFFKYGGSDTDGVEASGYTFMLLFFGISIGIETEVY